MAPSNLDNTSYERDGFAVLRQLLTPAKVERCRADLTRLAGDGTRGDALNLRYRMKLSATTGGEVLDAIDPVTDLAPSIAEVAEGPALSSVMREVFGETPRLFKDKAIIKPPGCPGYAWHQDFISWPFFPRSFTTVLVAIDGSDERSGCLEFMRGSHLKGYLSPTDGDFHDLEEGAFAREDRVAVALEPGDAVVFGAWTVHGSGVNRSPSARRHLYLSYNRESDGGDQRAAHYRYFHAWLRRRYGEYGAKDVYFR